MLCRLGTKKAIIRDMGVKEATLGTVRAVMTAASGQKTPFYVFWAVKAAKFWAFRAVLSAASGQKRPLYAFWRSRRQGGGRTCRGGKRFGGTTQILHT